MSSFPADYLNPSLYFGVVSVVDAERGTDWLPLDLGATLNYTDVLGVSRTATTYSVGVEARGGQVVLRKSVSSVNGDSIAGTLFSLSQGENNVGIKLRLTNTGNDIARNLSMMAVVGSQALFGGTDSAYTFTYSEDERTISWINPFELYPGATREIPVELKVEKTEGYDVVNIMYAFTAEFTDLERTGSALRREVNPDTIRYFADLVLTDQYLSVSPEEIEQGDNVTISTYVHFRGNMAVKNVLVRFYENEDVIGEGIIPELSTGDSIGVVSVPFTVSSFFHNIIVMVDPDKSIGESSESNNTARLQIVTGSGNPLESILAFPSPFKDYTEFTYVVTSPLKKLNLKIFTVKGRLVKEFDNLPSLPGYNYYGWDGKDKEGDEIGNGTYIFKLAAETQDGISYEKTERIVRMR